MRDSEVAAGPGPRTVAIRVFASARVFAEVMVIAALLWAWAWTPVSGIAAGGEFYWSRTAFEGSITGTASYLGFASLAGFIAGVYTARSLGAVPWIALGASAVFGTLAGWGMAALGHQLGPVDADEVAAGSADGSKVLIDLSIEGLGAYAMMPAAALLGAAAVFLLVRPRVTRARAERSSAGHVGD